MQTQQELELEAYAYGMDRMRNSIERNETHDRAHNNPYAQAIYRRFVLPLAARIKDDLETKRIGRAQAHVPLLKDMDLEAVAFVAVRAALTDLLGTGGVDKDDRTGRSTIAAVGKAVYHEHLLAQFADAEPVLFYHLLNDMDRRLSTNERHRMTVMKLQARKNGVEFREWATADRDQVGSYLVDQLSVLGMVSISVTNVQERFGGVVRTKTVTLVSLTDECANLIRQISDFVIETTPYFLPCVEPPKDWTTIDNGGFHTTEMRRLMPWMVKSHASVRDNYLAANMHQEIAAVNKLQQVKWRINRTLLDHISNIAKHFDMEEIIAQAELPKPQKPMWLEKAMTKEDMTDSQLGEFKKWKREVAEWHTTEKVRGTKSGRFYNCLRVARKFVEYPAIYFVYFVDFRGRKYVQTTGVSPQGSDLQKAVLEFAEGKALATQEAVDWFLITGANRWGYDKASLTDRVQWCHEHHEQIMAFAADPVSNSEWREADKPLQFLAWCLEYAQWKMLGKNFLSRISVGMDGSCNGLQNFSAMLRDAVGGKATNLVPAPLPHDIYQLVADRTTALLSAEDDDEQGFRAMWLTHGLTRNLVKRSVMTLPYGSRRTSCREFIIKDYLREGKFPELDKSKHEAAADYLSRRVWAAICDVVVKAREAMDWLQNASTTILRDGYTTIRWITPSGFPVEQVYWETTEHRINSKLCGNTKLSLRRDTDTAKKSRHRNGIAPNFVHSLDASHLTIVVNRAAAQGIGAFHMVHDDYGTHAADAAALYRIIREAFVDMYTEHDVLSEFHRAYPGLPEPPAFGDLDIRQVLDSPYFFS